MDIRNDRNGIAISAPVFRSGTKKHRPLAVGTCTALRRRPTGVAAVRCQADAEWCGSFILRNCLFADRDRQRAHKCCTEQSHDATAQTRQPTKDIRRIAVGTTSTMKHCSPRAGQRGRLIGLVGMQSTREPAGVWLKQVTEVLRLHRCMMNEGAN